MRRSRRRSWAVALGVTVLAASCSSDDNAKRRLAQGCTLNSDCDKGLVCGLGRCHAACEESGDCPPGERCVKSESASVCLLPDETECTRTSECPTDFICAVDSQCREECAADRDCIRGQICATSRVCADPEELGPGGDVMGADAGAGGTSGGGAGGRVSGGGAGGAPDASMGTGGTAPEGGPGGAGGTLGTGGSADASAGGSAGASTGGASVDAGPDGGFVCVDNGSDPVGPTPPQCTDTASGIDIAGTVTYGGARRGRVHVVVTEGNSDNAFASVSFAGTGGPYRIRSVPETNRDITIAAYIDTQGDGVPNASVDPIGTVQRRLDTSTLTGVDIVLADPVAVLPTAPGIQAAPFDGGATLFLQRATNGFGHLIADQHEVYWDSQPSVNVATSNRVAAAREFASVGGLTNGTTYYFAARALAGGVAGPLSAVVNATPAVPSGGGATVSGTASFSCQGVTENSTLTMVAFPASEDGSNVIFAGVPAPKPPQAFAIPGVPVGPAFLLAFLDVNGDGSLGPGDRHTGFEVGIPLFLVQGTSVTVPPVRITSTSALVGLTTSNSSGSFGLKFDVEDNAKQPVGASVCAGPGIPTPSHFGLRGLTHSGQYRLFHDVGSIPSVGDTYAVVVDFADGTTETYGARVSRVFTDTPALVSPVGTGGVVPTLTWTLPASAPALYTQEVRVREQAGGDVWQYGVGPGATSIVYNVDGSANAASLTSGTTYDWEVTIVDDLGNQTGRSATFTVP